MDGQDALPPDDQKLFQDDFQDVPVDEQSDRQARKQAKPSGQSLDVLDGLVEQAKMEELVPQNQAETPAFQSEASAGDMAALLKTAQESPEPAAEPQDMDETQDGMQDLNGTVRKTEGKPEYPQDAHMEAAAQVSLEPVRVLEAALFLANKPMSHKQLQDLLSVPRDRLDYLLADLARVVPKESSYELSVNEHGAALQLKPHYLHRVAKLSKEVELSRKAMRILALVAKKKELMQSDLKHFFKGEIYAYVTELKMAGYLESKKAGNTRKLKPTSKFYESFQVKE